MLDTDFDKFLVAGKKGHLIGIGGVSMSPLAEVLINTGLTIQGSDMSESENTDRLRESGVKISIGHSGDNISANVDFIVRTAAVRDENPEIIRAKELSIPVFERTEAWGALMKDYENALCISGTHGKTTDRKSTRLNSSH